MIRAKEAREQSRRIGSSFKRFHDTCTSRIKMGIMEGAPEISVFYGDYYTDEAIRRVKQKLINYGYQLYNVPTEDKLIIRWDEPTEKE